MVRVGRVLLLLVAAGCASKEGPGDGDSADTGRADDTGDTGGADDPGDTGAPTIEERCDGTLEDLEQVLGDQAAFARFARRMIDDLGYGDQLGDDPDEMDDEGEDEASDEQDDQPDSTGEDDSQEEEAEANPERSQEEQQDQSQAQVQMDDQGEMEEAEERYTAEAQRQWAIAEARDMDNIEAGVQRLGDLVASGWFERNAKDGAMAELMEDHDSQAQP